MGHFAPFYYPHPYLSNDPENQNFALHDNHMMYGSWDMEIWSAMDRIFCHFGPFFALLPPNNLKNPNFENMKKKPWAIIILHV